ncbi:MAG: UvrD-helicase domain-containing protein [Fimbriimonadaceae bacterium]|nr:UvrD-helicase domain-containing protein [Fimbriimonadaceae bacterium]
MALQLNPQQQQAAAAGQCCAVVASAGTGKTGTLTARYLAELRAGRSPLQIVAVTFTDKAAGELRERIRQAVREESGRDSSRLAELDLAPISTFHTLCGRICREHPAAAAVAPGFTIQDAQQSRLFQQEHLDDLLVGLGPELYDPAMLSFGTARAAVRQLLAEPLLAATALPLLDQPWELVAAAWEAALAAQRTELLGAVGDSAWTAAVAYLQTLRSSDPEDRLAVALGIALEQVAAIAAGGDVEEHLRAIAGCGKGSPGAAKAWAPRDVKSEVRDPLWALRDRCKGLLGALAELTLGPSDEWQWRAARQLARIHEAVAPELAARLEQAGALDFAGLEVGALRALGDPAVRQWYAARWTVLLVDETQDVNRTQSELIEALITLFARPSIGLVGDAKQSIYGFRGAAVEEFARLQREVIGRPPVVLEQTWRQHTALAGELNTLFGPILGALHAAVRSEQPPPHDAARYSELAVVTPSAATPEQAAPGPSLRARRWVEANWIADRIADFVGASCLVSDRRGPRPASYGDIAILGRAWSVLDTVQEALAARGIPAVHGGGGSLLATREALDGEALLRFLAHSNDNLALAAVLRSPWCAVSDRALQSLAGHPNWWAERDNWHGELARPREVLGELHAAAGRCTALELLQLADQRTGYTAVLANLPLGDRRLADWRAFEGLVLDLQRSGPAVFTVCRRLRHLRELQIEIERPVTQAADAVSLLTIHAAKGLEFPIVFVPDLARQPSGRRPVARLDRQRGVALAPAAGEAPSYLWRTLDRAARQRDEDEARRLLYVACTRAGDRLILSAASDQEAVGPGELASPSLLRLLKAGWDAAGWPVTAIPADPARAVPPGLPTPPPLTRPATAELLTGVVGPCLHDVPASALDTWRRCPRQFRYQIVDGHPGHSGGHGAPARQVGLLVHEALEHDLHDAAALRRVMPHLAAEAIAEAARLVQAWHAADCFEPVRQPGDQREEPLHLVLHGLAIVGRIDRLGADYVVDYKTGAEVSAAEHELQVWAYACGSGRGRAYVADLRGPALWALDAARLNALDAVAAEVVAGIQQQQFDPRPDPGRCARCAYRQCEAHPNG